MAKSIEVTGPQFREFMLQLRAMDDRKVKAKVRRRLRAVADETASAAKSAAGSIPATDVGSPALRPMLQQAIGVTLSGTGRLTGVSVVVRSSRLPEPRRGAIKTVEFGGRHPVFARKGRMRWVDQAPSPWWREAVRPYREKAFLELSGVVDEISRELGFR